VTSDFPESVQAIDLQGAANTRKMAALMAAEPTGSAG
jgi:hypothetical protein